MGACIALPKPDRLLAKNRTTHLLPTPPAAAIDQAKQDVYDLLVIRSFADIETQRLSSTGKSRRWQNEIRVRALMRLAQLDAATRLGDLHMPPSNRPQALKGARTGQWSICIDTQWRVCFRFDQGDVFDVEIVEPH
jgi:toxin HigB-1